MPADQFGHFEHRDRFLPTEDHFEFVIGVDAGHVLLVLELISLDVAVAVTHVFYDLCRDVREGIAQPASAWALQAQEIPFPQSVTAKTGGKLFFVCSPWVIGAAGFPPRLPSIDAPRFDGMFVRA